MATITQTLRPFVTPNFVTAEAPARPRQDGWTAAPAIPLSELDADTLAQMCDDFRRSVFEKAGKQDPSQAA